MLRFYFNAMNAFATRGIAVGALAFGIFMAAMGALIIAFPQIFAFFAAAIFFAVALACILFAARMFFAARRMRKYTRSGMDIIDVDPL